MIIAAILIEWVIICLYGMCLHQQSTLNTKHTKNEKQRRREKEGEKKTAKLSDNN